MTEAALITGRIDEGGSIEVRHAELLWLSSASSMQAGQRTEISHLSGNDNGTHYRKLELLI